MLTVTCRAAPNIAVVKYCMYTYLNTNQKKKTLKYHYSSSKLSVF